MESLISSLIEGRAVDTATLKETFDRFCAGRSYPPEQLAALLVLLRSRGETPGQLAAFAEVLCSRALAIDVPPNAVSFVGTGGDHSGTFNISTAACLLLAACGMNVPKYGNRAVTSQCGSADVLAALGIPTDLGPEAAAECLVRHGFAFLMAPIYLPAYRYVAPVRAALKVPTLFNILGPLLSSAIVERQLIGVFDRSLLDVVAGAAAALGYRRAMIVCSDDGIDEVTLSGPTQARLVEEGTISGIVLDPRTYGFSLCTLKDLQGGSAQVNARIIESILAGESGPAADCVVLNTGVCLFVGDAVATIEEGVERARDVQTSGAALQLLNDLRRFEPGETQGRLGGT